MAHPYTAFANYVLPTNVNTFLTALLTNPTLYKTTHVSSGAYGAVFAIEVDIRFENPFKTFYITDSRGIITTSDNRYLATVPQTHRFCCKIVGINTHDEQFSFTNECNKQLDIYAKTNENLNAVCLPLFFYSIVSEQSTDPLKLFINAINATHGSKLTPSIMYGISFMPYSMNSLLPEQRSLTARDILNSDVVLSEITKIIDEFDETNEDHVIQIFESNIHIYSFCVVLSLIIRLYFAGYCHGDLHLGNIIVYPCPSGMHETGDSQSGMNETTRRFFIPTLLLIDTGFAFKHSSDITLKKDEYEGFKLVIENIINIRSPNSRQNMMSWDSYFWFPKIFIDGVGGDMMRDPTLNEPRCKFIFVLFQYFERYRTSLEAQRLTILNTRLPELLTNIRAINTSVSKIVDAYIASIPGAPKAKLHAYNSHGGRRRNYYVSNRKQTKRMKTMRKQPKINKKHTRSMRRRKSQKRRLRRQRIN